MEISGATMTFGWEGSQSLDCERLVQVRGRTFAAALSGQRRHRRWQI
jgi:hypothetical protein